jgi:ABC-type Fe3+/spermidine/putrescine transport system ATPase subunit
MSAFLTIRELSKTYGAHRALQAVSLDLGEGEILGLLGPSGSGKSTLLRCLAGLEAPDAGSILLHGSDLSPVAAHRRGFGLMFQDYALFPHLSVSANIGFGLRGPGWSRARRSDRIRAMLELVRLEGFARRDVLSLSGGEQQRVALARALAPSPRLLMLDEPLGALDPSLRRGLLDEMAGILHSIRLTVLYVTHDQDEAFAVCHRVALLRAGCLEQIGEPRVLVERPASSFVASFLGLGATLAVHRLQDRGGTWSVRTALADFEIPRDGVARPAQVLIRPAAVSFCGGEGKVRVRARVVSAIPRPAGIQLKLSLAAREGDGTEATEIELVAPPQMEDRLASFGDCSSEAEASLDQVWIDQRYCVGLSR